MGESFWQKESLLKYTMTLLQGPKDPILPSLIKVARSYNKIANKVTWLVKNRQNHANVI